MDALLLRELERLLLLLVEHGAVIAAHETSDSPPSLSLIVLARLSTCLVVLEDGELLMRSGFASVGANDACRSDWSSFWNSCSMPSARSFLASSVASHSCCVVVLESTVKSSVGVGAGACVGVSVGVVITLS